MYSTDKTMIKNPIFKYMPIFSLVVLIAMVAGDWASPLFFSDTSIISLVEAKDKDKDKDKDADCKGNTGICSNQGTVTVKGMKNKIDIRSGSGAVLLDVTSDDVDLESKSGDLTARGLTKKGKFKTRTGNVRVRYCKKTQDISGGELDVEIKASAPSAGSDADLQFPAGSTMKIDIKNDPAKFKSDFESCHGRGCGFKIKGSVEKGNLFISEYNPPAPPCKY